MHLPEGTITVTLNNIPFDSAVEYVALAAGLKWTADDNGVLLTAGSLPLLEASYSLPGAPAQQLAAVLAMCHPKSWSAAGGPGTMELSADGIVKVKNTLEVHQELDEITEALRYAATRGPIDSPYRWISDVKSDSTSKSKGGSKTTAKSKQAK